MNLVIKLILQKLHVNFRDQSLENERLRFKKSDLAKRNNHLEAELMFMLEIQKEGDVANYVEHKMIKKATYLEQRQAKSTETIRVGLTLVEWL